MFPFAFFLDFEVLYILFFVGLACLTVYVEGKSFFFFTVGLDHHILSEE